MANSSRLLTASNLEFPPQTYVIESSPAKKSINKAFRNLTSKRKDGEHLDLEHAPES
jgi:hypothetical protein